MSSNEEYLDKLLQALEGNDPEENVGQMPDAEMQPQTDLVSGPDQEPGNGPEDNLEPEVLPEIELMPELERDTDAGFDTEPEPEPEYKMESKPELIPEPAFDAEPEPELTPEPEPEADMELEPEPGVLPAIDDGLIPEIEVLPEPGPERSLEEESEAVPEMMNDLELEADAVEPAPESGEVPEVEEVPPFDMEAEVGPEMEMTEDELEMEPELEAAPELEPLPEMEDELAAVLGDSTESDFGIDLDIEPDKQMSVEEIAALLQSIPELDDEADQGALSPGNGADDMDLMNLMGMMPEDEGVSEINDLLEKNDSGEPITDDVFAMLAQSDDNGGVGDNSPLGIFASDSGGAGNGAKETGPGASIMTGENGDGPDGKKKGKLTREEKKAQKAKEKERKAAEKAAKKAKKKAEKNPGQAEPGEKPEKKKGFFGKILDVLTEEAPEDDITIPPEQADGTADSENLAILQAIDNAPKDKKAKKEKKPKKEKEPKPKKEKKPRKPKKEKKPKEKVEGPPEKKIPMRRIVPVILVCGTLLAAVLIVLNVYPKTSYVNHAQEEFDQGNYEAAYQALSGWELSGDDEDLYKKTVLLAKMRRRSEVYLNYVDENDIPHILDALIQAVKYHDNYAGEAAERGVGEAFEAIYQNVLSALAVYDLPEEQAREFAAISDNVDYSIALEDFIFGPPEMPEIVVAAETPEEDGNMAEGQDEIGLEAFEGNSDDQGVDSGNGEEGETPEPDGTGDTPQDGPEAGQPEESFEEHLTPENQEVQGGNVSPGGERLLYEFGVEKGSDGKYHGGQ